MSEDKNLINGGYDAKDKDAAQGEGRPRGRRRRKVSYLTIQKIDVIDYKDVGTLKRFINDRGKMLPRRQTGNTASQQRMVARAIKRAREMALLPFVVTEMSAERREYRGRDRYQPYQEPAPKPVEEVSEES